MPIGTIVLIILVLLLIGALPTWPYSAGWGAYPAGGLGPDSALPRCAVLRARDKCRWRWP